MTPTPLKPRGCVSRAPRTTPWRDMRTTDAAREIRANRPQRASRRHAAFVNRRSSEGAADLPPCGERRRLVTAGSPAMRIVRGEQRARGGSLSLRADAMAVISVTRGGVLRGS
jgi:hypothetical protein